VDDDPQALAARLGGRESVTGVWEIAERRLAAGPVRPPGGPGPVPTARETTTATGAAAIGSAVANWAEQSNGRIEARTFALDAELGPDAVGDTLPILGLQSVPSLKQGYGRCSATPAWQQLFAAASAGGAYNSGDFGAYGRLFAWRSGHRTDDASPCWPPPTPTEPPAGPALYSGRVWAIGWRGSYRPS
jgi:hypothetical protein